MGTVSNKKRKAIHDKYDGHCAYCGNIITIDEMHPDHILPKSKGGSDAIANFNPSCKLCNSFKSDLTLEEFEVAIMLLVPNLFKQYHYRVAHHFGLLKVTNDSFKFQFYFETLNHKDNGL
ncbi:MAG: HNH endonuclease [Parcubacteria group bacterium]|jgi:5-methylcytosine-specific restriction endonuclease McrA